MVSTGPLFVERLLLSSVDELRIPRRIMFTHLASHGRSLTQVAADCRIEGLLLQNLMTSNKIPTEVIFLVQVERGREDDGDDVKKAFRPGGAKGEDAVMVW